MYKKKFDCDYLEWDSNYFGVESGRVNLYEVVDNKHQQDILEFSNKLQFVTISNYDNKKENNYWIANKTNAFLTDVNIQLIMDSDTIHSIANENFELNYNIEVSNNTKHDNDILKIANSAFKISRFYNDPNLSVPQKYNIYTEWCKNSFYRDNKFFAVANVGDSKIGFLTFSKSNFDITIELIAVDTDYQSMGVAKNLIQTLVNYAFVNNVISIKVGTQVNNVNALNFYSKRGFRLSHVNSVYHYWNK